MATNTSVKPITPPENLTPPEVSIKERGVKNLRYMRDKDREIVKGIFRFYEVPGGQMSFSIKLYKEDDVERYDLVDGEVYSLPLGIAKHLNKNGNFPIYAHTPGEPGVRTGGYNPNRRGGPLSGMRIERRVQRFGFQSLEFIDIEGLEEKPDLLIAEKSLVT